MSVISNFPAMPNRFAVVCEYLHFLGEEGGAPETVEKQLSPLQSSEVEEEGGDNASRTSISEAVLSEMEKLKLVRNNRERIFLLPDIRVLEPKDGDWLKALKPLLFKRMTSCEEAEAFGQPEVPDAISWLLAQDPMDPLPWQGGVHAERIMSQLGEQDPRNGLRNNSRYQNLVYWSRYLGFAERMSLKGTAVVVPDPTEAISSCLPGVFGDMEEMPIEMFMQRIAKLCPVIDGGTARQELEVRMPPQLRIRESHLSRSTSLSLLRLQRRAVLDLKAVSDAKTFILETGETSRGVSHIVLQGGISL